MKGTRPLDNDEIRQVAAAFTGTFAVRNRGLFILGVSTGGRISELLGLRIKDVWQNGKAVSDLLYTKQIVKGGEVSRSVPVNADGRKAIDELVNWHREHYSSIAAKRPLFPSRHQSGTMALHRQSAHEILKTTFIEAGLNGHIATHSLRKSLPRDSTTRPATSTSSKSCSDTGASRQRRNTWVSTMRMPKLRSRRSP